MLPQTHGTTQYTGLGCWELFYLERFPFMPTLACWHVDYHTSVHAHTHTHTHIHIHTLTHTHTHTRQEHGTLFCVFMRDEWELARVCLYVCRQPSHN